MRYAIEKQIEDVNTGVESSFHLLTGYSVTYPDYIHATVSTYVNKKVYESGKQSISQTSIQVLGLTLPIEGNVEKAIVDKLVLAEETAGGVWVQNTAYLTGGKVVELA